MNPKQKMAAEILTRGNVLVEFSISGYTPGLKVPGRLLGRDRLCFIFGRNLPDLTVTDRGIGGTLSFAGEKVYCFVPWPCVFAIYDEQNRGGVWWKDAPVSVTEAVKPEPVPVASAPTSGAKVLSFADFKARKAGRK